MNANLRTNILFWLTLLCTLTLTSPVQAQSNATDSTFFPMHQGNRWVFTYWDGIQDYGHLVRDIKDPVLCDKFRCVLSLDDSNRMGFLAAITEPPTWNPGNMQIEFDSAENIVYYRIVSDTVSTVAIHFDKEVGFKWVMGATGGFYGEHPIEVVREVAAIDTFLVGNEIRIFYHIKEYAAVNGQLLGSIWDSGYTFRKGYGNTTYSGCLDCLLAQITAVRINGEVLFGDITVSNEDDRVDAPDAFRLEAAYPNPFNPTTTLRFALAQSGEVSLAVYDVLGRQIHTQKLGALHAGDHSHALDMSSHPSGTYLVRMQSGGQVRSTRITLVK